MKIPLKSPVYPLYDYSYLFAVTIYVLFTSFHEAVSRGHFLNFNSIKHDLSASSEKSGSDKSSVITPSYPKYIAKIKTLTIQTIQKDNCQNVSFG